MQLSPSGLSHLFGPFGTITVEGLRAEDEHGHPDTGEYDEVA